MRLEYILFYLLKQAQSKSPNNKEVSSRFEDSIKVDFIFNGENIPLQVKIDNKSGKTLYVDWDRSSVIVNGQRFSAFVNHAVTYSRSVSVSRDWWVNSVLTETRSNGLIIFPESKSQFPNDSYVIKYIGAVGDFLSFQRKPNPNDFITTNKGRVVAFVEEFDETNSSLNLRMNLTLSYDSDFNEVFNYEEYFYVSKLAETKAKPSRVLDVNNFQGYTKNISYSQFLITTAIILPVVITILLLQ